MGIALQRKWELFRQRKWKQNTRFALAMELFRENWEKQKYIILNTKYFVSLQFDDFVTAIINAANRYQTSVRNDHDDQNLIE